MKDRQRLALIAAGALIVVVVGAVALFGLLSPPSFRDLRDDPATEAPGTVAFMRRARGTPSSCIHLVAASGADEPRELTCPTGYATIGWSPNGTLGIYAEGRVMEVHDPVTGEIVREDVDPRDPFEELGGSRRYDTTVRSSRDDRRVRIDVLVDDDWIAVLDEPAPGDYWIRDVVRSGDGRWVVFSDSDRRLVLLDVTGSVEPGVIATDVDWPVVWSEQPGR